MTDTTTNELIAGAHCYNCYPDSILMEIETYIMAYVAGVGVEPLQLAKDAACLTCMSTETLLYAKLYLLRRIAQVSTDPVDILEETNCYECIPTGFLMSVETSLLVQDPGSPSTTLSVLANSAKCFRCLSPQTQLEVQVYLLSLIAAVTPTPAVLVPLVVDYPRIPPGRIRTAIVRGAENVIRSGGLRPGGGCHDVPHTLIPVLTSHYTAGIITSVDILLPKVCCSPTRVEILDTALDAVRVTVAIPAAVGGTSNYTVMGVDMTGAYPPIPAAGYYAKQVCSDGSESNASNNVLYSDGQAQAETWADAVVTAGGAHPSQTTIDASAIFYDAIVQAGILSKFKTLNLFVPDNLTAARTPLITGVGSSPYANSGFVAADLTVNGLIGNGAKYLDTGVDPSTAFASDNTGGISIYTLGPNGGFSADCGAQNATGGTAINMFLQFGGVTYWQCYSNAGGGTITYASPAFTGFVSMNRTAANNTKIYDANSGSAFAQRASGVGNLGNRPTVGTMIVFGYNNNGAKTASSLKRFSFVAIHDGLTSSQAQALYNAVQTFRTTIGGGFV